MFNDTLQETKQPRKSKAQLMRESGITNEGKLNKSERKDIFVFTLAIKEFNTRGHIAFNKSKDVKVRIEAAYDFVKLNKNKYSDFKLKYSPKPWNAGIKSINRFNECERVESLLFGSEVSNG